MHHLALRGTPTGGAKDQREKMDPPAALLDGYARVASNGAAHAVAMLSNFLLCMDECVKIFIARHVAACLASVSVDVEGEGSASAPSISVVVAYEAPLVMAILALNGALLERAALWGWEEEEKRGGVSRRTSLSTPSPSSALREGGRAPLFRVL